MISWFFPSYTIQSHIYDLVCTNHCVGFCCCGGTEAFCCDNTAAFCCDDTAAFCCDGTTPFCCDDTAAFCCKMIPWYPGGWSKRSQDYLYTN